MKLCKDCEFYCGICDICTHPESKYETDPVSGHEYFMNASNFRYKVCSVKEARYFEPKKSFITKIVAFFKR